jgi:hypothetical protein
VMKAAGSQRGALSHLAHRKQKVQISESHVDRASSIEHVRDRGETPGSLTAAKQKAGYKANGTLLIAIFRSGISRPAPPHPGQRCSSCNKQPAGVLKLAKLERKQPQSR